MSELELVELGEVSEETQSSNVPVSTDLGTVSPFIYLG